MSRLWKLHWRGLALLLAACLAFVALMRSRFDPIARELAITQVKNKTSDLINDAIAQQIATGDLRYDKIIHFEKDDQGRITALETDMSEVNRLKTDILNRINDEILEFDTSTLDIRIGSVILPELFSGMGPQIPVEVLSIRNSDGNFVSHFYDAGINQTLQQVSMEVTVDVTILVLSHTETFTVMSEVVVAETIIVGEVPETFFQSG